MNNDMFYQFYLDQMMVITAIADGLDDNHNNARERLKSQARSWYDQAEFYRKSLTQDQPG